MCITGFFLEEPHGLDIDFPSDYILRKRLGLADDEVSTIRQAYGYFQDTVREVLQARVDRLKRARALREGAGVKL